MDRATYDLATHGMTPRQRAGYHKIAGIGFIGIANIECVRGFFASEVILGAGYMSNRFQFRPPFRVQS